MKSALLILLLMLPNVRCLLTNHLARLKFLGKRPDEAKREDRG